MKFIRNYFLRKFKIYSKIFRSTRSKNGKNYLYIISYRVNSAKTLIRYLYSSTTLYIDRKSKEARKCLCVEMKYQPKYTQQEDKILKQQYLTNTRNHINALLPRRTWSSIEQRARLLGIYKYNKSR